MPGSRKVEDIWGERGKRECRTTKERERERGQWSGPFISAVFASVYISSARRRPPLVSLNCTSGPSTHHYSSYLHFISNPPFFINNLFSCSSDRQHFQLHIHVTLILWTAPFAISLNASSGSWIIFLLILSHLLARPLAVQYAICMNA